MNPQESARYASLMAYLSESSARVARLETSSVSERSIASTLRERSRGVSRFLAGENLERFRLTLRVCNGDISALPRLRKLCGVR